MATFICLIGHSVIYLAVESFTLSSTSPDRRGRAGLSLMRLPGSPVDVREAEDTKRERK